MRMSALCFQTLREVPKDADTASHQLMLRASLMKQVGSGVYEFLPLGWRAVRKVEDIVREEMDRAGAQEILMTVLSPRELWEESGRWRQYGKELMRLKDRHERDYALGPTHEEVVTDLVRSTINSWRKLPVNLYQIQTKFRDEVRPRFGVMRSREFIMKDAYSFDADEKGCEASYERMRVAYNRIFTRLGLNYRMVESDSGLIGGAFSHEFMVLAESGEAVIAVCDKCDYAANLEKAEPAAGEKAQGVSTPPAREVATPGTKSVEAVAKLLGKEPREVGKILFYEAEGTLVAAMVRGDHEVNEVKLGKHLGVSELALARPETVAEKLHLPVGYIGPVGLKDIRVIYDRELAAMTSLVTGANKSQAHLVDVVPGRDFPVGEVAQVRSAAEGDGCPKCGGKLKLIRGIEVGQIFKLGTKYSKSMKCTFLDDQGKEREMVMGCYGIGITRTVAAAIEQNHDDKGIIWPSAIAPYHAVVLALGAEPEIVKAAGDAYDALNSGGVETLLDDRADSPGVKFRDADLIGTPVQVLVGKTFKAEGLLEIRKRGSKDGARVRPEEAAAEARRLLAQ
jgi:prolyl-tRNA synthetase